MNFDDMKTKSLSELNDLSVELAKEEFNLRMQKATGQLTKTHMMKQVRRNIARVKTLAQMKRGE